MSKAFLWFGLLLSAFLLFVMLTSAKGFTAVGILWAIVLIGCVYKLFLAKPKAT